MMNTSQDLKPTISILIVTYNSANEMETCIPELLEINAACSIEIIVVDNASSDDTPAVLNTWKNQITIVLNPENMGFGTAVNQGAAISEAPYILLLNPDAQMTRDVLVSMHEFLEMNSDTAAVGPRLVYPDGHLQPSRGSFPNLFIVAAHILKLKRLMPRDDRIVTSRWNILGRFFKQYAPLSDVQDVDYTTGACVLIRKDVFNRIGGFDEDFFLYYEEIDLALRLKESGFRWVFLDTVSVVHTVAVSSGQLQARSFYERYRSMMIYFCKHGSWIQIRGVMILIRMMALVRRMMLRCPNRGIDDISKVTEMCEVLVQLRSIGPDTVQFTKKTAANSIHSG